MSFFTDKQIRELEKYFNQLAKKAGNRYLKHFLDSFKNEGFTDKKFQKWTQRSRKDKNKKKRGLLTKTGRLQRSLKLNVTGTRVTISSTTPYAEIHNEGGTISGTAKVKRHKRRITRGKRKRLATVKAHTRRISTKIPKRQFMGESEKVTKELQRQIEKEFRKIFK